MSSQRTNFISPEEYLAQERLAERKSEYFQGRIFAMSGASRRHVLMVSNLVTSLCQRLDGTSCEVYSNDMRLRVTSAGLYTYPDVMVTCGEPQFADGRQDTLLNPVLIIEVLSESTRGYDVTKKFEYYRSLPSLVEYLTVEQDGPRISQWTRGASDRWDVVEYSDLTQSIPLRSINCDLPLSIVYKMINWPSASSR